MSALTGNKKLLVVGLLALALLGWVAFSYNTLVEEDTVVDTAWASVETQYQRRLDLVPNLVSTVKGAADFEQSTFTDVTNARANVMGASSQNQKIEAFQGLDSALARLLVTVEAYPQLQATQSFRDLMAQLEGTENRISVARRDYNEAVKQYTVTTRRFPTVLLASLLGFGPRDFYEAVDGADAAPAVDF